MKIYGIASSVLNFLLVLRVTGKMQNSCDSKGIIFPHRPKVIGHRGCAGLAPENTLSAFVKAIDLGVDAIEFDVHCTRNGEVVVYHDMKLNPETTKDARGEWIGDTPLYLRDLTFRELQEYTIGEAKPGSLYAASHLFMKQTRNERIPTLRQIFDLARRKGATNLEFFVELKTSPIPGDYASDPETLVFATLEQIQAAGVIERTHILSFDARSLHLVHSLSPRLRTNYLIESGLPYDSPWIVWLRFSSFKDTPQRIVRLKGGFCWSPQFKDYNFQYITAQHIKEAHKEGLMVVVWTPNEPEDLQKMIDLGVDGITTDRPDILLDLLKRTTYQGCES
jgi:glycerophosphoryl diester phosphodiesterase